VLKVVGAGVLLWLGLRAWRSAWRGAEPAGQSSGPDGRGRVRAFVDGVVVQLANPKLAIFMIAFYPQFVPADRPLFATTAALALLQVLIETVFYTGLAYVVGRAGATFRSSAVRRRLDALLGTVLVGLGVRVALSSR
jgi:threonine/homoserine/homoserine lactone efflux protein